MKKVRILSIDGGGIRGILPGIILNQLEIKLQKQTGNSDLRLSDMFDFMAGTSTGGILTLSYLTPNRDGRPKLTAMDAVNLYLERGDEIFDVSTWHKMKSVTGFSDEKYDAKELEEALHDTFEETKLNDLLKPCIITSYDIRNGKPHFFKQSKANSDTFNFSVKDIARATSAAPTYFETARIKNNIGTPFPLIDGGVFANNPALVAYSESRTMKFEGIAHLPTAKDMMIVSIGTGSVINPYEYKKAKNWGAIGWIKPLIDIMMSGNAQTVHYHLTQIYDTLDSKDKADYHRLEPKVIKADTEMDNACVNNMMNLKEDALNYLASPEVDTELNSIVDKLIKYGK
ncbi:MAG: patatin-like phospholipase family protein [Bacteroidales bacterium]|nr:patatin-like phospholipase family protein [Bacteroidales bacterium]